MLSIDIGDTEDRNYVDDQIIAFNSKQVPFTQLEATELFNVILRHGKKH